MWGAGTALGEWGRRPSMSRGGRGSVSLYVGGGGCCTKNLRNTCSFFVVNQ